LKGTASLPTHPIISILAIHISRNGHVSKMRIIKMVLPAAFLIILNTASFTSAITTTELMPELTTTTYPSPTAFTIWSVKGSHGVHIITIPDDGVAHTIPLTGDITDIIGFPASLVGNPAATLFPAESFTQSGGAHLCYGPRFWDPRIDTNTASRVVFGPTAGEPWTIFLDPHLLSLTATKADTEMSGYSPASNGQPFRGAETLLTTRSSPATGAGLTTTTISVRVTILTPATTLTMTMHSGTATSFDYVRTILPDTTWSKNAAAATGVPGSEVVDKAKEWAKKHIHLGPVKIVLVVFGCIWATVIFLAVCLCCTIRCF
jgi:hypothetical protein